MPRYMVAMVRPERRVVINPIEEIKLSTHEMEIKTDCDGGRWGIMTENLRPDSETSQYETMLCGVPGEFYRHRTDRTLYITVFDAGSALDLAEYSDNLMRLQRALIRNSMKD